MQNFLLRNRRIRIFLVAILLLAVNPLPLIPATASDKENWNPNEWELVTAKEGITVYRREDPNSNMFEFKGQGVINAPPTQVLALLQDVKRMPDWVDGCTESDLVMKNYDSSSRDKKITDFRLVLYGRNAVPWPLSDRDYVLEGRLRFYPKTNSVFISLLDTTKGNVPAKDGAVRMNFMRVRVIMKGLADNTKTWFQLYVHVDPGGVIPSWIVNFITKSVPLKSIRNLRTLVKKEDHDKAMEELIQYHYDKSMKK